MGTSAGFAPLGLGKRNGGVAFDDWEISKQQRLRFQYGVTSTHEGLQVQMTPALAQRWLDEMSFDRQRRVRQEGVERYAAMIRKGHMRYSVIDVRVHEGRPYLVNGQHRLRAVILADLPLTFGVTWRVYGDFEDILRDYVTFDIPQVRKTRDHTRAYGLHDVEGISNRATEALRPAARMVLGSFTLSGMNQRWSEIEISDFQRAWTPLLGRIPFFAHGRRDSAHVRKLYNSSVMPLILLAYRFCPERAPGFWEAVAANDGIRAGTPEATLIEYLRKHKRLSNHQPSDARHVAMAWNAYYEGKPLSKLIVKDHTLPLHLLGTPYTRARHLPYEEIGPSDYGDEPDADEGAGPW